MRLVKRVSCEDLLFENGARAFRLLFDAFQESAKARHQFEKSLLCHRAALVVLFREIAARVLRSRGLREEGLRNLETGLFPPADFFERLDVRAHLDSSLASVSFSDGDLDRIGDLYNELQALRVIDDGGLARLATSDSHKKQLGSYFTHAKLTALISEGIVKAFGEKIDAGEDWKTFTFCDNSCGSGHILRQILEDLSAEYFARGFFGTRADARRWLARNSLYGIDRDPFAVWLTRLTVALQTAEKEKPLVDVGSHVVLGDALLSSLEESDGKFSYRTAFPEIFRDPAPAERGFTAIAGNPPWETVEPRIQDFYKISTGSSKAPARRELDAWLADSASRRAEYEKWAGSVQSYAAAIRASGYGQKVRKVFTYAYFIERSLQTLKKGGRLSYVVKLGLCGDLETAGLREQLFRENRTTALWIFRANKIGKTKIFPRIDPNEKFVLFETEKTKDVSYRLEAKSVTALEDLSREFQSWQRSEMPADLDRLHKVEVFETETQKRIAQKARALPTLKIQGKTVTQELNLTTHRDLFGEGGDGVPIYRGDDLKPFALAGHSFISKDPAKLGAYKTSARNRIGVNDIIPNSRRKLKASFVPARTLTANSILVIDGFDDEADLLFTLGAMNSFLTEFVLRPRLSNMHLNVFRLHELPLPSDPVLKREIAALAGKLREGEFHEHRREYLEIEALMSRAYGLNESEIRGYLSSFAGVENSAIEDVVSLAKEKAPGKSG